MGAIRVRRVRDALALLLRSEAERRRRTYALLFAVFLAATTGLSLLLGAVAGVEDAVGRGLRDTVTSDHRLAQHRPERLGEGPVFLRASAVAARIAADVPGARAVPRLEFDAVFLHTERYEDFATGLAVGVDPVRDADVARVAPLIVAGRWLDAQNVWIGGTPYPQLVVGEDMLRGMNLTVFDGELRASNLLNVTAGRFQSEGQVSRPVVREGVVVGAFRTGFLPLDRGIVYMHQETARELLRVHLEADAANVVLVAAPPDAADALARAAQREGLDHASAREFREEYLNAVFVPLRAFARLVTLVVLALAGGWATHVVVSAVLGDRRRLAVLRALGLPTTLLVGPVALALLVAAAAGAALGLTLGALVAWALSVAGFRAPGIAALDFVALPSTIDIALLGLAVVATVVVAAAGAGLALRRIGVADALTRA